MTPQQGADTPVPYEGDRYGGFVIVQNPRHGRDDAGLCVGGAFPAPEALLRMGEEPVRRLLEFRWWQEARGGAVVVVQVR